MNFWNLENKTALVTAGSEGIGRATAQELLQLGATVLLVSCSESKLASARAFLGESRHLQTLAADLSEVSSRKLVEEKVRSLGPLDILVNNLGSADRGALTEMAQDRGDEQLRLNLTCSLDLTRRLFGPLKDARGSVINVTSVAAHRALPHRLWYGTAKAALEHATRHLAVEWGPQGIRVNAVAPWFTRTAMTAQALSDVAFTDKINSLTPLRRFAEPPVVDRAIAFLALPASQYSSGAVVRIDGGYLAQGGVG